MYTDPISDFLTRVRNASRARKEKINMRYSKMIESVAQVLQKKGFVRSVNHQMREALRGNSMVKELVVTLYTDREPVELKRISKPGQRIYIGAEALRPVRSGFGIGIISTSKGIVADDFARKNKLGGEYICKVW